MSFKGMVKIIKDFFPSGPFVQIYTFLLVIEYFFIEPDTHIMGLSTFIADILIYAEIAKRPFINLRLKKFIPAYHLLCVLLVMSAVFLRQFPFEGMLWSGFMLLAFVECIYLIFSADRRQKPASDKAA